MIPVELSPPWERVGPAIRALVALAACAILTQDSSGRHALGADHRSTDHQGVVSIDARHAEQEAHFEHSELTARSPCEACLLTGEEKITSPGRAARSPAPKDIGSSPSPSSPPLDERLTRLLPSRAPPLP